MKSFVQIPLTKKCYKPLFQHFHKKTLLWSPLENKNVYLPMKKKIVNKFFLKCKLWDLLLRFEFLFYSWKAMMHHWSISVGSVRIQ